MPIDEHFELEDYEAVSKALTDWWRTQNIDPQAAAYIMARLAGEYLGNMLNESGKREDLREGVQTLAKALLVQARCTIEGTH